MRQALMRLRRRQSVPTGFCCKYPALAGIIGRQEHQPSWRISCDAADALGDKTMNTKEFPSVSTSASQDPPHRAVSREPEHHNLRVVLLGSLCAVAVLCVLWALYTLG
jgi:hypothetical protein